MVFCPPGTTIAEAGARNEYLAAENRILKAQLKGRLKLSDAERATLAEIGHRLGRKVLAEVATVARPDTILAWYRKLVARKFGRNDPSHAARARSSSAATGRQTSRCIKLWQPENPLCGCDIWITVDGTFGGVRGGKSKLTSG